MMKNLGKEKAKGAGEEKRGGKEEWKGKTFMTLSYLFLTDA